MREVYLAEEETARLARVLTKAGEDVTVHRRQRNERAARELREPPMGLAIQQRPSRRPRGSLKLAAAEDPDRILAPRQRAGVL